MSGEPASLKFYGGPSIRRIDSIFKAGKDDLLNCIVLLQFSNGFPHRNLDRKIDGKPVDSAADGWECETSQAMLPRNSKTRHIALRKQFPLAVLSAVPHRPDGMNDVPGRKAIAFGELCLAGLAATQQAALVEKLRTGSAMNRSINASAAQQGTVGGVDDGIDGQGSDVGLENLDSFEHYFDQSFQNISDARKTRASSIFRTVSQSANSCDASATAFWVRARSNRLATS